jgi:putative FmdB family regulatory protein
MPLYDFECPVCHDEREVFLKLSEFKKRVSCLCGERMRLVIKKANKDWFESFVSEDFNGKPIEVTSKKRYRELCKEHGVTCKAL